MAQHLLLRVTDILKLSDCLRGIPGVVDVDLIQYNGEYQQNLFKYDRGAHDVRPPLLLFAF